MLPKYKWNYPFNHPNGQSVITQYNNCVLFVQKETWTTWKTNILVYSLFCIMHASIMLYILPQFEYWYLYSQHEVKDCQSYKSPQLSLLPPSYHIHNTPDVFSHLLQWPGLANTPPCRFCNCLMRLPAGGAVTPGKATARLSCVSIRLIRLFSSEHQIQSNLDWNAHTTLHWKRAPCSIIRLLDIMYII